MRYVLSLFSGVGGFDLGLQRAGFSTTAFCENDKFCQSILRKHWPEVPIYDDIRNLTADRLRKDGIRCSVIVGGFPCQDISIAGRGAGITGSRSALWFEYRRLIDELRPSFAIIENSPKLRSRGLDVVLRSLDEIGFNAEWDCIPASYVGAPHRRDRIWILAHRKEDAFCSDTYRLRLHQAALHVRGEVELRNEQIRHSGSMAWWRTEPRLERVVDGLPSGLDKSRIRTVGNAVVPWLPQIIAEAALAARSNEFEALL